MLEKIDRASASENAPTILARGEGASIAYRRRPGSAALPGVMFCGGFRSDMNGVKALAIETLCAERDQAFVRFDYEGHGASSGRFEDCVIGTWLDDSLAVFDQLTEGPQILVGSSMGAWLALLVALRRPERVRGLVTVAGAPDFTEELIWARLGEDQRKYLLDDGVLRVPSAYSSEGYLITRRLIEEGRRHLVLQKPIRFDRPVRILHGMNDADVPWQHSMKLASALTGSDVVVTLVKSGDHRLSTPADIDLLRDAIRGLAVGGVRQ